jgi:poly-gamma-glutamate synthesis protein (capsule biosynthesis protein)
VKSFTVVPKDVMTSLARIHQTLNPDQKLDSDPESLRLFGTEFETGAAFGYRYQMDALDLEEILKSTRQGKQHSDFLIASIHSHESATNGWPETPAGFLKDLAHAEIDAGADAFVTTGHHHLGPIEIYKNRPIFYGLANFFWGDIQEPLSADLYRMNREKLTKAFQFPGKATDADLTALLNSESFANTLTFQTIVAVARFDQEKLSEIRLYPVDLGYGMVLTESGTPRMATPEVGKEILTRLQKISEPYGTRILIEDNIGIIRPN